MSIIKRSKRITPFVQIDREALQNKCLSWKSKGLLGYLLSLPDDWQIYVSELKQHATDGRDSTANALKELIKNGYVTREKVQNKDTGRFEGYDYTVYDQPVRVSEKPKPENPETDKPETGTPSTDNPITEEPITVSPNSENPQLQIIHNTDKEDTDKQKDIKAIKQDLTTPSPKNDYYEQFMEVMSYLSEKSGNKFRFGEKSKVLKSDKYKKIAARLKEYSIDDLKAVIDVKCKEWADSAEWCKYLVPKTLFCASNFEKYLDQVQNAGRTFAAQPLQPEQDDYQLPEAWEKKYQEMLTAYNKRPVAARISYFNRRDYISWYAGQQFKIYNVQMIKEKIYKKIASVVSGLDSMPIYRNAQGKLSDFVKNAFTGKIRELG